MRDQRAAEREHLLLAAGERAGRNRAALAENRKALVECGDFGFAIEIGANLACDQQIFFDAQLREHTAAFGNVG